MFQPRGFPGLVARYRAAPRVLFWGWAVGLAAFFTVLLRCGTLSASTVLGGAALLVLCVWNRWTQRLVAGATPFLAQGVFYELSGVLRPLFAGRPVHIAGPYLLERALFGVSTAAGALTPNELFARHHCALVDLIAGGSYILYIYEVLALLLFLSFTRHRPGRSVLLRRFGGAFFAMSLAGYLTYQLFPAAPPWYVSQHGFGPPDHSVVASPAAALRWDLLTGIPYFQHFYRLTTNTFGAIPSLHVAYAAIVSIYAFELRKGWLSAAAIALCVSMGFAAVYLQHHYVLDVLAGVLLAVVVWAAERFIWAFMRRRWERYETGAATATCLRDLGGTTNQCLASLGSSSSEVSRNGNAG